MTDKELLEKIKKLADAMYNRMQNLTTDTSGIRKAMDDYHQFIIFQYYEEEPVSEGLEEAATLYAKEEYSRKNPATLPNRCVGCYAPLMYAFKAGAKWQKEHPWKPADGDDLPEYEREVVVFTQIFPDDTEMMRVAIGHRPNPDGWDGKSLSTGKVEHYTPKTYGKGGWNIPDVKFWLDVDKLPNVEEACKLGAKWKNK